MKNLDGKQEYTLRRVEEKTERWTEEIADIITMLRRDAYDNGYLDATTRLSLDIQEANPSIYNKLRKLGVNI